MTTIANAESQPVRPAKVTKYIIGFVLSLGLTLGAYFFVRNYTHGSGVTHRSVVLAIAGLAITQLLVQLIFFLHIGEESKPRWNLLMLGFAVTVVFIVVAGSIWIMYYLNYNMNQHSRSVQQQNQYLQNQDSL